jgi:hypothetical protein
VTTPEDVPVETAPLLRVINADATPEEIAAITAVLAAMSSAAPAERRPTPAWSHNRRKLRTDYRHGVGGWRASGLPR